MLAEQCYQMNDEGAVPLEYITIQEYTNRQHHFTAVEVNSMEAQQFMGNVGDKCLILDADGTLKKVLIGAGDDKASLSLAIASVVNRLPAGCYKSTPCLLASTALVWALSQYRFDQFKVNDTPLRVLVLSKTLLPVVLAEANAIFLVRDLINTPANILTPQALAAAVEKVARPHGALVTQCVGADLIKANYPAIHAVGRASDVEPRLVSLTWGEESHPKVTLVGKGVCFDSGGLDLKSSSNMRLMKKDMGGAAQVIGLAQWIMTRQLPVRLHVLIPAVENAIGGNAFRPGDILTMRNGLTVEVDNTDAEGRLVLADALVKACEDKPDLLIDFATLTGAARVAVGTEIGAMYTNRNELAQELQTLSEQIKDPVWHMPLFAGYATMLDSKVADLSNATSVPYAGAIVAALFLQRFVDASIAWVHFDIMAWNVGNKPGKPEGGEAMGLQTVGQYLFRRFGQSSD